MQPNQMLDLCFLARATRNLHVQIWQLADIVLNERPEAHEVPVVHL